MPNSTGFQVNEILTAANTNTYLLRPYRNAIINGAMNINQRPSTATGLVSGDNIGTADRWFIGLSSAGTWTETTQALNSADAPLQDGVRNSIKFTCTTANASLSAGSYGIIGQKFEGYNVQQFAKGTTNAKNFALSFWVRSNRTGTYNAELFDHENNRSVSAQYTISAAGSWQKVRLVFPADITGLLSNDNNWRFSLFLWVAAGTTYSSGTVQSVWATPTNNKRASGQVNVAGAINNYFEITGVQLEPNNVCTPYEWIPPAHEVTMCQRYFFRINNTPQYEPIAAAGINTSATGHARTTCVLPAPMRKNLVTADMSWATVVLYDGAGLLFATAGAIVGHVATSVMLSIDWNSAGSLTTGRPVVALTQPNAGFFQVSAEL